MQARWSEMGPAERLIVGGAVVLIVGYLLGIVLENWGMGLSSLLVLAGAVVALLVVITRFGGVTGLSRAAVLRISVAVAAAISLVDVGDLLVNLTYWDPLDIVLSAIVDVAAFVMLWGVWTATGGALVSEIVGVLTPGSRPIPSWLAAVGSALVIVAWLFLGGSFYLLADSTIAMLAAILVLAVLWADAGGGKEIRLPVASGLILAGLGVIAAILALAWLARILGLMDGESVLVWLGLVLYVGGALVMAAGGLLSVQQSRPGPPA